MIITIFICNMIFNSYIALIANYEILAKVPALSCRLGRVPCDHAFGALMGGGAPYDHTFVLL